jgi:hypothetical protein
VGTQSERRRSVDLRARLDLRALILGAGVLPALLFATFCLTAPPNPLVVTVIALCALSITVVVFVILDLDEPYRGLFGVSGTSMRNALADTMR